MFLKKLYCWITEIVFIPKKPCTPENSHVPWKQGTILKGSRIVFQPSIFGEYPTQNPTCQTRSTTRRWGFGCWHSKQPQRQNFTAVTVPKFRSWVIRCQKQGEKTPPKISIWMMRIQISIKWFLDMDHFDFSSKSIQNYVFVSMMFNEGFHCSRGVDEFGRFFIVAFGNGRPAPSKRLRSADARLKNPSTALKSRGFFMFFTTLGGNGQIPMLIRLHDDYMISNDIYWYLISLESCTGCTKWDESCWSPGFFSSKVEELKFFFNQPQLWNDATWNFNLVVVCCTGPFCVGRCFLLVGTWMQTWFNVRRQVEKGTRLLNMEPATTTDAALPSAISPKIYLPPIPIWKALFFWRNWHVSEV